VRIAAACGVSDAGVNARLDAQRRLDALERGRFDARVLEPAPPADVRPPWFADDPVATAARPARTVVSPVSNGDTTWDRLAGDHPELQGWCAERWLGAWPRLDPIDDPAVFASTRHAWHALGEHVLAPARHRACAKIGLRFTRHGVGTPYFRSASGVDEQVRVEGAELIVDHGDDAERRMPITTLRAATTPLALHLGVGTGVYDPTTPAAPDEPLTVEARAAACLGSWFGFAASVLEELRVAAPDGSSTRVQLWPEHFDLSIDLGDEASGQRGTFGASPGDAGHPLPYLYVNHWAPVADDEFWNDSTFSGASRAYESLVEADRPRDAAFAFFGQGRDRLHRA
jgi:hypothetical protein